MMKGSIEQRKAGRKTPSQGLLILRTGLSRWFGSPSPYANRFEIVNISEGGVCFEDHLRKKPFEAGQRVVCQIHASHLASFRATSKVAWSNLRKRGGAPFQLVGLSFQSVPGRARREIDQID